MHSKPHLKLDKKFYPLFILIIFLIFTLAIIIFVGPSLKQSIIDSNVINMINESSKQEEASTTREQTLFYTQVTNNELNYEPVFTKVKRYGGTASQDAIEALLIGPPKDLISEGFINLFPSGTKLIGSILVDNVYFIDFSKQYAKADYPDFCLKQIEKTLLLINPDITEVRITVK